jgi:diguanylate cyclase (GGDEF)-like protein
MLLDYNSLLLAIGFSGACLSVTLFGSWLAARTEGFMLTWAVGGTLMVGGVFGYDRYSADPGRPTGVLALALLLAAFAVILGAARQFRLQKSPWRLSFAALAGACICVLPFMAVGSIGLAFIMFNVAATALLLAAGREYLLAREESPWATVSLGMLYMLLGASFALCAVMLVMRGISLLHGAPNNWAENLNVIVSITCVSGIGALSLALNQSRLARSHRRASLTDGLTGLLNRRALFDAFGKTAVKPFTAIVLFDLDRFKQINDDHGHAVGDEVLRRFAAAMTAPLRPADFAARLGGEEFLLVLTRSTPERATRLAEEIRQAFAAETIALEKNSLRCTVSAGLAFAPEDGDMLDALLNVADKALYEAKRGGRNRIGKPQLRLAG